MTETGQVPLNWPTLVSIEHANRAPYTYRWSEDPLITHGRWAIMDNTGRERNAYWGGNSEKVIADAVDRLNTECAKVIMTHGTPAEGL